MKTGKWKAKIEWKNPANLIPYAKNAKIHTKDQINKVAGAISAFGFTQPIVVDKEGVIVAGHCRREAAIALGMGEVPTIVATHLTDEEIIAARIADNRVSEAPWDPEMLKFDLGTLDFYDFKMELTGFDALEVKSFLESGEIKPEMFGGNRIGAASDAEQSSPVVKEIGVVEGEDETPEPPKKAKTKPGQVYQLGDHRLMCGDSTKEKDVSKLMNGENAEMAFTSPPYNLGDNAKLRGYNGDAKSSAYIEKSDHKSEKEYLEFLKDFTELTLKFAKTSFINIQILAGNKFVIPKYWSAFENKLIDIMIWDKEHAQPSAAARVLNSVWEFIFIFSQNDSPTRSMKFGPDFRGTIDNIYRLNPIGKKDPLAKDHGAVFPVQFVEFFVSSFSNKTVLDLFGGSGSTLIACEKTKRRCFMMEIDPRYCDVIVERWEKFTGKKAKPVNSKPIL